MNGAARLSTEEDVSSRRSQQVASIHGKGTRAQEHKSTRAQGHKGTRAQVDKRTRTRGREGEGWKRRRGRAPVGDSDRCLSGSLPTIGAKDTVLHCSYPGGGDMICPGLQGGGMDWLPGKTK
jgi:hypothetical protein